MPQINKTVQHNCNLAVYIGSDQCERENRNALSNAKPIILRLSVSCCFSVRFESDTWKTNADCWALCVSTIQPFCIEFVIWHLKCERECERIMSNVICFILTHQKRSNKRLWRFNCVNQNNFCERVQVGPPNTPWRLNWKQKEKVHVIDDNDNYRLHLTNCIESITIINCHFNDLYTQQFIHCFSTFETSKSKLSSSAGFCAHFIINLTIMMNRLMKTSLIEMGSH